MEEKHFSYSQLIWKQFKKNKLAYLSLYIILFLFLRKKSIPKNITHNTDKKGVINVYKIKPTASTTKGTVIHETKKYPNHKPCNIKVILEKFVSIFFMIFDILYILFGKMALAINPYLNHKPQNRFIK